MPAGAVIVDVSIDQGGCVAMSRPTTHSEPVFVRHGVTHYCVTNMPGAYARTSTFALTRATLPEPHIAIGNVVCAGVDYAKIGQASAEADMILWDGGNNDFPFVARGLL